MVKTLRHLFLVLCFSTLLSGCGIIDYYYLPPPEDTAQEIFDAGNEAMREKNYAAAISYFTRLTDNFPFSPYAIEAELSLADAYFLDEEWGQAVEAYKEFESMHPRHEAIPYVLYNIGMANISGYPSIDRPTTQIEEAYSYFSRLQESYPGTEYAEAATHQMVEARRIMAKHEIYIADFYFRMGKYSSALARYTDILNNFEDVEDLHAMTKQKAKEAFIKERENAAEATRTKREGSWKDYFQWL